MLRQSASRSFSASSAEDRGRLTTGLRALILVAAVLSFLSVLSLAQVTSGAMFGSVKDPSGAVVSGATVTVHSDAIGVTRTVLAVTCLRP